jgi:hypothetical protein
MAWVMVWVGTYINDVLAYARSYIYVCMYNMYDVYIPHVEDSAQA